MTVQVSKGKWAVSIKTGELFRKWGGHFEVSVERLPHGASWGWFGADKIRMEHNTFEEQKEFARLLCDLLNAHERRNELTRALTHD